MKNALPAKAKERSNLRVPTEVFAAINAARANRPGSISRNTWITEAIQEKLTREASGESDQEGTPMLDFYEFFAGGGMARIGFGPGWRCLFANDMDEKKAAAYQANFNGAPELRVCDVADLLPADLPGAADLAWASFPCQDLSLAGHRGGLAAARSGAFWPFWRLMQGLMAEQRAPRLIVLENVCGALTSHEGQDFLAIAEAFTQAEYPFGAMVIDAAHFLPHSRPRLFVIGARSDVEIPPHAQLSAPDPLWHPAAIRERVKQLSFKARRRWVWWRLPPRPPQSRFRRT